KGKIKISLYTESGNVDTENFKVIIYNSTDEIIETFEPFTEIPDEVSLEVGNYYIIAQSGQDLAPNSYESDHVEFKVEEGGILYLEVLCKLKEESNSEGRLGISLVTDPMVNTENFVVTIYNTNSEVIKNFERFSEIPEEVSLEEGSYYIIAHSGQDLKPNYYESDPIEFEVIGGELVNIEVPCLLREEEKGTGQLSIGLYTERTVNTENFAVTIYNNDDEVIETFERFSEVPDEINLEVGDYYVIAHSGQDLEPYYYESDPTPFEIKKDELRSFSIYCPLVREPEPGILSLQINLPIVGIDLNDFEVSIFNDRDQLIESFGQATQVPTDLDLEEGTYYVVVTDTRDDLPSITFDETKAKYGGSSDPFVIIPNQKREVSISCVVQSANVGVEYTEAYLNTFKDWQGNMEPIDYSLSLLQKATNSEVIFSLGNNQPHAYVNSPNGYWINVHWVNRNNPQSHASRELGAFSFEKEEGIYIIRVDGSSFYPSVEVEEI
ncbi:DUF4493 domain-containing protein, partial [Xanthovirga aplysinae]|uniref:DUF4493 domain-containing protein n=1 Tax=Xanthovirga aplysinae TaxID=2529853 RepID=UPI0012BC2C42